MDRHQVNKALLNDKNPPMGRNAVGGFYLALCRKFCRVREVSRNTKYAETPQNRQHSDYFMATIHKKVWKEYFELILSGKKKLELRLVDFEINEADTLVLEEWDKDKKEYTGRKTEHIIRIIGHISGTRA